MLLWSTGNENCRDDSKLHFILQKKKKYKCLSTGTAYILEHCTENFTSYNTRNKQLADQKGYYFVALLTLHLLIPVSLKVVFAVSGCRP